MKERCELMARSREGVRVRGREYWYEKNEEKKARKETVLVQKRAARRHGTTRRSRVMARDAHEVDTEARALLIGQVAAQVGAALAVHGGADDLYILGEHFR